MLYKLVIILSLCFIPLFASNHYPHKKEDISLVLSWKHQFQFAGYYMAKHKGFYDEVDLNVDIKEYEFGINVTNEVMAGKHQFGVGRSSLVIDKIANKQDVLLLAAIFQHSPLILHAKKRDDIKTITDIKNKKVMVTNDKAVMAAIEAMLVSNGLKQSAYEPIEHSFNPEDLINGKTDLMASYISNEPFILKERGIGSTIFDPKDYGFNFYGDILFTSNEYAKKNPRLVDEFYKATIKGWIYAFDNIDETVDVILKHYNQTLKKSKEALLYEGRVLKNIAYVDNIPLGNINKYKLDNIANTYYLLNVLNSRVVDLEDIIYKPLSEDEIILTKAEKDFLRHHKVLRVHNEMDWIPYNFYEDGVAKGYSIDYMNLVASKLGINVEYVSGPTWSEFLQQMKDGSLDIMLNIRQTSTREDYLSFTKHYAQSFKGIFTNQENLKTFDDLKGKRVAVIKDFFIHDFIKENYPSIITVPHDNVLDSLISLTNGNADAAVNDIAVMKYVSQKHTLPIDYVYVLNDERINSKMGMATSKENIILRDILQKAMDSISDLQVNILQTKWLGKSENKKVSIGLTPQEKKWINENIVKIGIENWKPMTYYDHDNDQPAGVVGDIVKVVVDNLGLKVKYVPDSWNNIITGLQNKKIDMIPDTYFSQKRLEYGVYTDPYLEIKDYIYFKADRDYKNFQDIKDKKIAIIKGYTTIGILKAKYPNIQIVETKDIQESIDLVLNGDADALIEAQIVVEDFIKNNIIVGLKGISQGILESSSLHFFIQKDKAILKSILQKGLDSIDEDTKSKILAKVISKNSDVDSSFFFTLTKMERDRLKDKKIVKMCNNPKWEPIEFAKDGDMKQMEGIVIDTLAHIEKKLNIRFENVPTSSWSESQQFLKERKCDILPSAIKTAKREEYANFTQPYLDYKLAIITKTNIPHVNSLDDIVHTSMSRNEGSGLISKLKKQYPNIDIKETKGYLESLREVQQGKVNYTIATLPIATYFITKYAMYDLHIAGYTDMRYKLSIAVRNDDKLLLSILDKALKDISAQEFKNIHNKWTSIKIQEQKMDPKVMIGIGVLFAIIILISLFLTYRQYMLKKINAALKSTVTDKSNELEKVNTELLKYSRDLQELNENLEQKIIIEVEKSKKMEHKLFESEKMAAMGEMIGNIAHQWRQPLSVISTSATGVMMQKEYGMLSDESLKHFMDEINDSAQFLSQTIDDFRDLIKGDAVAEKFSLTNNINRCLQIEKPILNNYDINLITNFDDSIEIVSYPNALVQSMINVINNAKDILLENEVDQKYIFITTYLDGNNAVIEVKDNGGGIPDDIIGHIFEPYFTTKHKTQGTGLGLNMTYTMISKDMKGKVEAFNETFKHNDTVYTGAVFKINIPLEEK